MIIVLMGKHLKQAALKDVLAQAEHELQETVAKAERLKELISATRKLTGKGGVPVAAGAKGTVLPRRRRRSKAIANPVKEILRQAGKPMHVQEIITQLERRGEALSAKYPGATVAAALKRRPEEFEKVGPNRFALVKHRETTVVVE